MRDKKIAKSLFFNMLRIRMIEERIAELYSEQEMRCPVHLCIGQEAIAAGICANLSKEDYVLSNHRSHGHYLAKGGNLKAMMAELYGRKTGCSNSRGGSMHLIDLSVGFLGATPIVASTIPMAVGVAMGTFMKQENRVTVVFFGDAAVEEGAFHESINFAVARKVPIVFVCENNLYSVNSPLSVRQPVNREIFQLASGYGIESYQADGNDALKVYELARRAIQKAKLERYPVFLEFKTYRWREHCGPNFDHQIGFRPEGEFNEWMERCPIEKMKSQLLSEGSLSNKDIKTFNNKLIIEIDEAVLFAKESPFPEEHSLLKDIYSP